MDSKTIGKLLTPKEAAERLHCNPGHLHEWRENGTGPKYFRLGYRTIRYCAEDVERWLREREAKLWADVRKEAES